MIDCLPNWLLSFPLLFLCPLQRDLAAPPIGGMFQQTEQQMQRPLGKKAFDSVQKHRESQCGWSARGRKWTMTEDSTRSHIAFETRKSLTTEGPKLRPLWPVYT